MLELQPKYAEHIKRYKKKQQKRSKTGANNLPATPHTEPDAPWKPSENRSTIGMRQPLTSPASPTSKVNGQPQLSSTGIILISRMQPMLSLMRCTIETMSPNLTTTSNNKLQLLSLMSSPTSINGEMQFLPTSQAHLSQNAPDSIHTILAPTSNESLTSPRSSGCHGIQNTSSDFTCQ